MKNILYYTKYTRLGASSRLRSYQYFPFLEENNFNITVSPFFKSSYLEELYSGKKISKISVVNNYIRRFFSLLTLFKYDLIIIEKELFPYLPAFIEQILSFFNIKYIVDYDDALFHLYDQNPNKIIRKILGNKIDIVMRNSSLVICGNDYLAARAIKSGAKKVKKLPTVIDLGRYLVKNEDKKEKESIVIGWIGTPATLIFVKPIEAALLEVIDNLNAEIQFVGGVPGIFNEHPKISYVKWTETSEINSILNFDIGIMPILDDDWAKGKCAYKLIQYMGCGLPVVGSYKGMNIEVIDENINGFLAKSHQEWVDAITELVKSKELRKKLGTNGRKKVEQTYTLEVASDRLLTLINDTL